MNRSLPELEPEPIGWPWMFFALGWVGLGGGILWLVDWVTLVVCGT